MIFFLYVNNIKNNNYVMVTPYHKKQTKYIYKNIAYKIDLSKAFLK